MNDNQIREEPGEVFFELDKTTIRLDFIRKVYSILATQLCLTTAVIAFGLYSPAYRQFLVDHSWTLVVAVILNICCAYAIYCFNSCGRKVPNNYICLTIFTLTEAYMFSGFTSFVEADLVFIAAALTAAMSIALTIYALTTETDITMYGGFLFIFCFLLFVGGILGLYFPKRLFAITMSALAIICFGLYLIYDTQLIMGNKLMSFGTDDYVIASTALYVDIMRIFLEILNILVQTRDDRK
jgi:FtsH-binding integral membrane protein